MIIEKNVQRAISAAGLCRAPGAHRLLPVQAVPDPEKDRRRPHNSASLEAPQSAATVAAANVIASWPVHPAPATAYRKGKTILDNAKVHAKSKYLLRMDLHDFFPSLKMQDLREYAKQRSGLFTDWTNEDFESFGRLIFREGQLTIGAPTSPAISNALCFDLDVRLTRCVSPAASRTRDTPTTSSSRAPRREFWRKCKPRSRPL